MSDDPVGSIAEEAGAAEPVAEASGNGVGQLFSERLRRLIEPNPRSPADFVGQPIAQKVNEFFDGKNQASSRAQFGEAVNLCVEVALGLGDGAGWPPLVHLAWNGTKLVYNKSRWGRE